MRDLIQKSSVKREFSNWARSQAYDVELHVDETGPVTVGDIKTSIRYFVEKKTYDLMLIYFAGHGILKGPNDEKWLLSKAPQDVDEAVNLPASQFFCRKTGIPHVVFISDACRSLPNDLQIGQVTGSVIVPNLANSIQNFDLDQFYATEPGDPSYEIKEEEAVRSYNAVYTKELLRALSGKVPSVISKAESKSVIHAYELSHYLRLAVPDAIQKKNVTLNQNPSASITSRPPKHLAVIEEAYIETRFLEFGQDGRNRNMEQIRSERNQILVENTISQEKIKSGVEQLLEAKGRTSFETRTGFTIVGENKCTFHCKCRFDEFEESGKKHIRIFPENGSYTGILVLPDGTASPIAILEGFIGTIVINENRIININYLY